MAKRPLSELQAALALVGWEINESNVAAMRNPAFVIAYVDPCRSGLGYKPALRRDDTQKVVFVLEQYGLRAKVSSWVGVSVVEAGLCLDLER